MRVLSWDTDMGMRYRLQVKVADDWKSASGILDGMEAEPILRALRGAS